MVCNYNRSAYYITYYSLTRTFLTGFIKMCKASEAVRMVTCLAAVVVTSQPSLAERRCVVSPTVSCSAGGHYIGDACVCRSRYGQNFYGRVLELGPRYPRSPIQPYVGHGPYVGSPAYGGVQPPVGPRPYAVPPSYVPPQPSAPLANRGYAPSPPPAQTLPCGSGPPGQFKPGQNPCGGIAAPVFKPRR